MNAKIIMLPSAAMPGLTFEVNLQGHSQPVSCFELFLNKITLISSCSVMLADYVFI